MLDIRSHVGSELPSEDVVCWCEIYVQVFFEVGHDEDCKNNEF